MLLCNAQAMFAVDTVKSRATQSTDSGLPQVMRPCVHSVKGQARSCSAVRNASWFRTATRYGDTVCPTCVLALLFTQAFHVTLRVCGVLRFFPCVCRVRPMQLRPMMSSLHATLCVPCLPHPATCPRQQTKRSCSCAFACRTAKRRIGRSTRRFVQHWQLLGRQGDLLEVLGSPEASSIRHQSSKLACIVSFLGSSILGFLAVPWLLQRRT